MAMVQTHRLVFRNTETGMSRDVLEPTGTQPEQRPILALNTGHGHRPKVQEPGCSG
jgi:hypothetical protein